MSKALLLLLPALFLAADPCFFYFPEKFTSYDLKDTRRLDPASLVLEGNFMNERAEPVAGRYFVNVCQNAKLPEQCVPLPPSNYYFLNDGGDCRNFAPFSEGNVVLHDKTNSTMGLTFSDKKDFWTFQGVVLCDWKKPYPELSLTINDGFNVIVYLKSKYSCGKVNVSAEVLSTNSYIICVILILFGMLLLIWGGISYRKFMTIILITMVTIVVLIGVLYLFDFELSNYSVGLLASGSIAVGVFIRWLQTLYKWVEKVVIGYTGAAVGINVGWSVNPDGTLFQKAWLGFIVFSCIKVIIICVMFLYADFLILIINSFLGATLVVYNMGYMCGYLPNFFALADEFASRGRDVPIIYKVNVGIMLVFALMSIFGQMCLKSAKKEGGLRSEGSKENKNYDGYFAA